MDDIFGDRMNGDSDEDQAPEMLPDLPEGLESEIQGTQNDDDAENQKALKKIKSMKGASKNTVKRQMPKLDSMRLTGERGIAILPRVFQDVKMKGKGHEVEDLRVTMRYLEHWAHRLFPMMPFDEVLERIDRLGTKRDVQTFVKKMRMDMPVLGDDFVSRAGDDDGDADDARNDQRPGQQQQQRPTAEDLFDSMVRDSEDAEAEIAAENDAQSSRPAATASQNARPSQSSAPAANTLGGLSAEMMEKIERNKRLAMERRAKMVANHNTPAQPSTSNQDSSSAQPSTSNPASTQPSTSNPASAQPSTSNPASTQPSTSNPASTQPSTSNPASTSTQPSTSKQSSTSASSTQPSSNTQPSTSTTENI